MPTLPTTAFGSLKSSRRLSASKFVRAENPRLKDLKLLALAPRSDGLPNFQFPNVWKLDAMSDGRPRNHKVAGLQEEEGPPDHADPKTGRAPVLRLRHDPDAADPNGEQPSGRSARPDKAAGAKGQKAYPAGKRLTTQEVKRSVAHAPVDPKSGKPICWDAACHVGCHRENCPNTHEPLPALGKYEWPCRRSAGAG